MSGGEKSGGEGATECPRFAENERILCFHGPLIYEAKIQKVESKKKETRYLVHYHGWNKNWDEWVNKFDFLPASIRSIPPGLHFALLLLLFFLFLGISL
jgi:hypothetical protein